MDEKFSSITDILKSPPFEAHTPTTSEPDASAIETPKPIAHTDTTAPPTPHIPSTQPQQETIKQELINLRDRINTMLKLLDVDTPHTPHTPPASPQYDLDTIEPQSGTVIEGVFDGQHMIDAEGKQYFISPNYASKSKLVEGDMMKLTITHCGAYIYKQIAPTQRQRVIGTVAYDEQTSTYSVQVEHKAYKVLKASIAYYKLEPGKQTAILIPQDSPSHWAAVDSIVTAS